MDTLYAWSPIRSGTKGDAEKKQPGDTITLKVGDTVIQEELKLDDEGWAQLLSSGAVRFERPPDMPATFQGSPIDFLKEQARKASEDAVNEVMASPEVISAIRASNIAATGSSLMSENVPTDTSSLGSGNTIFTTNNDGELVASEDGGESWRPTTDEEKAAHQ